MAKKATVNEKKAKGNALKQANKAAKDAKAAAEQERRIAAEWNVGANSRGAARAEAAASKADEAARKRAEKAALLAQEEAEIASSKPKKVQPAKKGKKKNDISLLEDSLVGDAEKKVKAEKRAARLRREKEAMLQAERERKAVAEKKNIDPLLANTESMIGNNYVQGGRLNENLVVGEVDASGMDAALGALSVAGDDNHPEKRMKALHKAFEEKMMPQMKEEYPGLKRSQYLEKIFAIWKKSPENPMNWPKKE